MSAKKANNEVATVDFSEIVKAIRAVNTTTAGLNKIGTENLSGMLEMSRMSGVSDLEFQSMMQGTVLFLSDTAPKVKQTDKQGKAIQNKLDLECPRAAAYSAMLAMQKAYIAMIDSAKTVSDAKESRAAKQAQVKAEKVA